MKALGIKWWPCILAGACLLLLTAGSPDSLRRLSKPPQELKSFIDGNTAFATETYRALGRDQPNMIISPYSLSVSLAVAHAGAKGQTETQIARAAHFPTNRNEFHSGFARVRGELERLGKGRHVQLNSATSLWAQKNYGFNRGYTGLINEQYDASVELVDFGTSPNTVARDIGLWIKRHTRGMIDGGKFADAITTETKLVIANALYFKGSWASRFEKEGTRPRPFWVSPTVSVDVPMMRQENDFLYVERDNARMVVLPYVGGELSMVILMPNEREGLAKLESDLDAGQFDAWADGLGLYRVNLEVPRFKIASDFGLGKMLESFGMTDAFDGGRADFSAMSLRRPLFIQAIRQSSIVEVNEEGTVAASATHTSVGCASPSRPPPREFHADHPFLFLIRENSTGIILFLGRVMNPADSV